MVEVIARPPNYNQIEKTLDIKDKKGIVYTYGDTIYNPDGGKIDEPLLFHEGTHAIQQKLAGGPDKWWEEYLKNPAFRFLQELEAYRNQYKKFCELTKDREKRALFLHQLATDLSSPQYGNIIDITRAKTLMRL